MRRIHATDRRERPCKCAFGAAQASRNGYNSVFSATSSRSTYFSADLAHRTVPPFEQSRRRADGRRDRSAVPPAVQALRRGLRSVGDGGVESAASRHGKIAAPHRSRRRAGAGFGADRRRRSGADGRGGPLQRGARRADHRHQHGLPGEEGLQRRRGLCAARERAARRGDPHIGRPRRRRPGDAQDPDGHRPGASQRARDRAHRRGRRHRRACRARPHARVRVHGRRSSTRRSAR